MSGSDYYNNHTLEPTMDGRTMVFPPRPKKNNEQSLITSKFVDKCSLGSPLKFPLIFGMVFLYFL